jgi:BlaI family penicillinase repressor
MCRFIFSSNLLGLILEDNLDNVSLSDLQIAVIRTLWNKPDSSILEVVEALRPKRSLAHTTVATILARLEKRGLVGISKNGRHHNFHALVSEAQIQRSMVADLLSSLFMGNANNLLKHLVREDEISATDIEQIQDLFNRQEKSHD